jgi:2-polyprenyl-3-methyl-5-hydroxy-6-metoxy-1,4-benzoquinol methylase
LDRYRYLLWALTRTFTSTTCPVCGSETQLIRRKYAVTALRECTSCALRFRFPKDKPGVARQFYVEEVYRQEGLTTDLPSDEELQRLLRTGFAGTEKDFSDRVEILRAAGLGPGSRILDFGSSWGYGSWQFKKAGFEVFSYEIGNARKRYAREKLGCNMVDDLRTLDGSIDCFFSSHVIEHLPDPGIMFAEATRTLKDTGIFICYCPNGAIERERADLGSYDRNWGRVHPLMLTPGFMKHEATAYRFSSCNVFSDPTPMEVAQGRDGPLAGYELLTVAHRA